MITLVKTIGGTGGTPAKCSCGSVDFIRSGMAWACSNCGSYVPAKLSKGTNPYQSLAQNFEDLQNLHSRLKLMLKELEGMVK